VTRFGCILVVVTALMLSLTPEAVAKHVSSVVVCGRTACHDVIGSQRSLDRFNVYLPPVSRPARADRLRWFVVRVTIAEAGASWPPETWQTRFYPDADAIHDRSDGWRGVPRTSLAAYRRATAEIQPFGANPSQVQAPRAPAGTVSAGTTQRRGGVGVIELVGLALPAVVCAGLCAWRLRPPGRRTPPPLPSRN
jgi:hypothetical protein